MADDAGFLAALTINIALFIVFVILFLLLRGRFPRIYAPRSLLSPDLPPPIPKGMFGWLWTTLKTTDEQFYRAAGLDALIYTVFFRTFIYVFLCCMVFGVIILMPVNYSGRGDDSCSSSTSNTSTATVTTQFCTPTRLKGLDSITMSNVPGEDSLLWAHFFSAYIFVAITFFFMDRFYAFFIKYRLRYFGAGSQHCHSVLVRDIPAASANEESVRTLFTDMYGDEVLDVTMLMRASTLRKFLAERNKAQAQLDHVLAVKMQNPTKPEPQIRLDGYCCCGGTLVDAEVHLRQKITNLNESIATRQARLHAHPKYIPSAFVTFKSMALASALTQSVFSSRPFEWTVTAAPEPREVHWDNCRMPYHSRDIRSRLFDFATFMLVLFWAIPVTFVASLTTLENLSARLPFLEPVVNSSQALKGFLEGFLPTIALLLFMALLPTILTAFSTAQGLPSTSLINFSMLRKFFYFQVVNVFFVSLIAGSAFGALNDLISSPFSIVNLLGTSIPKTGFFFTNYVMLQALGSHGAELLRIANVVIYKIKYKFLAKSKDEKAATWAPGSLNYGSTLPPQLLIVILGLVYATVSPLMLPFACLFFLTGYVAYRYNLMYVYEPEFETGGQVFPLIFDRVMSGVIVYEITMIGILSLKKAAIQAPLLVPLLLYTIYYWHKKNSTFERIGRHLSQDEARKNQRDFTPEENFFRIPEMEGFDPKTAPNLSSTASDHHGSMDSLVKQPIFHDAREDPQANRTLESYI